MFDVYIYCNDESIVMRIMEKAKECLSVDSCLFDPPEYDHQTYFRVVYKITTDDGMLEFIRFVEKERNENLHANVHCASSVLVKLRCR